MIFFVDTEFNGFGGELISIALVPRDQSKLSFYEEVILPERIHPWVKMNVIPLLDYRNQVSREEARVSLWSYLRGFTEDNLFIADYPYDITLLTALLCDSNGNYSNARMSFLVRQPPREPEPIRPHNALSDAVALRRAFIGINF
jgi:hypothetical protein